MKEQVENFALDLGDYKNRIQIEREEMADILAKNFEVNGERHDASDFEWAAHQLLMAGYRKQVWISVDDRLPEDEIPVLVFTAKGTYYVGYYYKAVTSPSFTGFYADSCRRDVTHWMPLPEPPEMKGGAE